MSNVSIQKRQYRAFLSYSHKDSEFVERLYDWLERVAKISIWHDEHSLAASSMISTELADMIVQCRAFIIILSQSSVASGWVKEEYSLAFAQRAQFPEFRIIPIVIETCDPPGFLTTTKYIYALEGRIDLKVTSELLSSLHYTDKTLLPKLQKSLDIYISCSWRPNEAPMTTAVCRVLDNNGFRMIGDSITQSKYIDDRIEDIISSCGGLVAIIPDRGSDASQYKYMLREIDIAHSLQLPSFIVAASEINVPEVLNVLNNPLTNSVRIKAKELEDSTFIESYIQTEIDSLKQAWRPPSPERYIFLATDLDAQYQRRSLLITEMVQEVTGMECKMGDALIEGQIQFVIRKRITESFMTIVDISDDNLNTCIEAGVALGAGRRLRLVARGIPHRAPFMLSDYHVHFYNDDAELLGLIYSFVYPYRRRILNADISP